MGLDQPGEAALGGSLDIERVGVAFVVEGHLGGGCMEGGIGGGGWNDDDKERDLTLKDWM